MISVSKDQISLFRQSSIPKKFRIHFPDGEFDDIDENNIISESLEFTESLCSQDELKFGLCEASVIKFDCFDIGNMKGCRIQPFIEISYDSVSVSIPLGTFVVDSCDRNSEFLYREVEAYEDTWSSDGQNVAKVLSRVEKLKFLMPVRNEEDYLIEPTSFLYSNVNGLDLTRFSYNLTLIDTGDPKSITISATGTDGHYRVAGTLRQYVICVARQLADVGSLISRVGASTTDYQRLFEIRHDTITEDDEAYRELSIKFRPYSIDIESFRTRTQYGELGNIADSFSTLLPRIEYHSSYGRIFTTQIDRKVIFPYDSGWFTDGGFCFIYLPYDVNLTVYENGNTPVATIYQSLSEYVLFLKYAAIVSDVTVNSVHVKRDKVGSRYSAASKLDGFKPKDVIQGYLELDGLFGKQSRYGDSYKLVSLSGNGTLYPWQDFNLYPNYNPMDYSSNLYPMGGDFTVSPHDVITAWFDDAEFKRYCRVVCTFKDINDEEHSLSSIIIRTKDDTTSSTEALSLPDSSNYLIYDLSNNSVIKNGRFTESFIQEKLDGIARILENILPFYPADIDMIGFPFLEPGDYLHVHSRNGEFNTYLLRRTLSGINSLRDNVESR